MNLRDAMMALSCCLCGNALADPPADVMQIIRPADIKYVPSRFGPNFPIALLAGDPTQPGSYVARVKFPPGFMSPPHFHRETRYILVLKGTWWVGAGPSGNKDATFPVPAGSLVVHHGNKIHYDGAKDEEVELQILGIGPSVTTNVDAAGQPRQ